MKVGYYRVGNGYIRKDDAVAVLFCVIIFLIGAIMVQVGKRMDAEVEAQRQAEMAQIAHDKLVNGEVTR